MDIKDFIEVTRVSYIGVCMMILEYWKMINKNFIRKSNL